MLTQLIKNMNMSQAIETHWTPLYYPPGENFGKEALANSLQIHWEDASGTLDGNITVYVSNDNNSSTTGFELDISKASNTDDTEILMLNPAFRFIKLAYIPNGITGGKLNALIYYD